jgi:hypothetical protein
MPQCDCNARSFPAFLRCQCGGSAMTAGNGAGHHAGNGCRGGVR